MAVAQGYGKTVTSGSVFAYDVADTRNSYIGEPTTNLLVAAGSDAALERSGADYPYYAVDINSVVQSNWSAGNNTLTISFEGKRDYAVGGTGGGGDGYPVFYIYFTDWSWTATLGITSYDWTTNSYTFTMPNPSGKYVYFSIYHMNAGNPGKSYSRKHQIEFKPHKTQFVNGTRSATQGLLPLVGNSTIDLSNVSFNSNAQIVFDGTDDYINTTKTASNLGIYDAPYTMEAVFKVTNTISGDNMVFGTDQTAYRQGMHNGLRNGNIHFAHYSADYAAGSVALNEMVHVLWVYDGTTAFIYKNGVLQGSSSIASFIGTTNIQVGRSWSYFQGGEIPVAKIYNRALSAGEVRQNYLHYKTRFNLS
jgi:hypothetical protein